MVSGVGIVRAIEYVRDAERCINYASELVGDEISRNVRRVKDQLQDLLKTLEEIEADGYADVDTEEGQDEDEEEVEW